MSVQLPECCQQDDAFNSRRNSIRTDITPPLKNRSDETSDCAHPSKRNKYSALISDSVRGAQWFIVLFLRMHEDGKTGPRTSIKMFPCVADILFINPQSAKRRTGWSIVFIIGPVRGAQQAIQIRERWSSSQKGILSKVARGEVICRTLGLWGFIDWTRVFDNDVRYLIQ